MNYTIIQGALLILALANHYYLANESLSSMWAVGFVSGLFSASLLQDLKHLLWE